MYPVRYEPDTDEFLPELEFDADESQMSWQKMQLCRLYELIRSEQNYYQTHTATAFGNPDLREIQGRIIGFCMGAGFDYNEDDKFIIIKNYRGTKTLMKVGKVEKSFQWKRSVADCRDTMKKFLG